MVRVLFVCLGNICRSPTAEGIFTRLVAEHGLADRIAVDSAATGAYHVGEPPDRRAQAAARDRGIDIGGQRARQVQGGDFRDFDYVIAMDRENLRILAQRCPDERRDRLFLFLADFAPHLDVDEVPDPYYGGRDGFGRVFDLVEQASRGLLEHIRQHHL